MSGFGRPVAESGQYAATSPDLLAWFKTFNRGLSYRGQVKPFGFMHSLSAAIGIEARAIITPANKGRPKRPKPIKPIAPYDTDHRKSVAMAFDRETGARVSPSQLRSYADALCQYHISPESKFLNGDYLDRGTTERRHVRVVSVQHIGKEANEWERQAILGFDAGAQPDYGLADGDLSLIARDVETVASGLGKMAAAAALRITLARLNAIIANREVGDPGEAQALAAHLPSALERCHRLLGEQAAERAKARQLVADLGWRGAARRLHVDASNLKRQLQGIGKLRDMDFACQSRTTTPISVCNFNFDVGQNEN